MIDFVPPSAPAHGVFRSADAAGQGLNARMLQAAVKRGEFDRVRRGWYALPSADRHVARAVRLGGALTGPSAARLLGLWVPPDAKLHIAVPRHSSGVPRVEERPTDVCVHWSRRPGPQVGAVAPLMSILEHSVDCLDLELAVTIIDSALNARLDGITRRQLLERLAPVSVKHRRAVLRSDGASESGLESLVRQRLRSRGLRVRVQARRPGVGRVDLLVGDRLVIEVDGREFHDTESGFVQDRERDLELFRTRHLTLRLTYAHVMHRWPYTEAIILQRTRAQDHRWARRRGALAAS